MFNPLWKGVKKFFFNLINIVNFAFEFEFSFKNCTVHPEVSFKPDGQMKATHYLVMYGFEKCLLCWTVN